MAQTQLVACTELSNRDLAVRFDGGETITLDQIILATGYKVKIEHVPFLAQGNILERLARRNGFPILMNISRLTFQGCSSPVWRRPRIRSILRIHGFRAHLSNRDWTGHRVLMLTRIPTGRPFARPL